MSVTVHEMQNTIAAFPDIGFSSDVGNVIDVGDIKDDLGMDLLANTKYMSGGDNNQNHNTNTVIHLQDTQRSGSHNIQVQPIAPALQEMEFSTLEPLQPISIDTGGMGSLPEIQVQRESSSYENHQTSTGPNVHLNSAPTSLTPAMDPEVERKKKNELINKLQRLEQRGFPVSKRFTMDNSLEEIKGEYDRLVDAKMLENSIKFQRTMLMGFVSGVEMLNGKFDPFDFKLDGWSEAVNEDIDSYDDIFEELYDKYKDKVTTAPEIKLLFQLAGSGFMCHISNSFFRAKMPSAADIFNNNPELKKQFAAAAANQAGSGFGNLMGMAMGAPPQSDDRQRAGVGGPSSGPQGFDPSNGPTGAFFQAPRSPMVPQNIAAQPAPQVARREMKGPTGVDDILNTFAQVREAEAAMSVNASPPVMPSPAASAAVELQSLASEEMQSLAGSERTSGGRRRKRAAPTGNTISLNV